MCVSLCVCVCASLTNDSLETIKVTITKLDTVTATDMRMHHVLIILSLTLIEGYTDLNHKTNNIYKYLIISETVRSNAHHVCCEDSPTKVLYNHVLVQ